MECLAGPNVMVLILPPTCFTWTAPKRSFRDFGVQLLISCPRVTMATLARVIRISIIVFMLLTGLLPIFRCFIQQLSVLPDFGHLGIILHIEEARIIREDFQISNQGFDRFADFGMHPG
jgi:hypothetical protein